MNVNRGRSRGKCFGGNLSDAGIKRLIYVSGSERREINISQKFLTLKPKVLFKTWIGSFCFVLGPSWFAIILIGYHPKYLYLLINVLWSWAPFKLNRILKETSPWGAQRLNLLCSLCFRPLHLHHRCIIYHHIYPHVSHLINDRIWPLKILKIRIMMNMELETNALWR